jgi:hypothetical protein
VVAPQSIAAIALGGGAPPGPEALSGFAVACIAFLIVLGALVAAVVFVLGWTVASSVFGAVAGEAAAAGASALGVLIIHSLTCGNAYDHAGRLRRTRVYDASDRGFLHGAIGGGLYATIVLAGAAIVGVQ